MGNPAVYGF